MDVDLWGCKSDGMAQLKVDFEEFIYLFYLFFIFSFYLNNELYIYIYLKFLEQLYDRSHHAMS